MINLVKFCRVSEVNNVQILFEIQLFYFIYREVVKDFKIIQKESIKVKFIQGRKLVKGRRKSKVRELIFK